jgi:eukaryotic-like serine/threonine-protein kinase
MATPDRSDWQAVSPLLDRALELSAGERIAWLASLGAEDPELAARVSGWLHDLQASDEQRFLEEEADVRSARVALVGVQIGAYRLVELIGQGGMGSVWLAERSDGRFQGRVAVKLLNAALVGHAAEERFKREGNILARLAHPQIAHLVDAGVSPVGQPFLVLEYIDGEQIDRYCDRLALSVDSRIRLFLDVLSAVSHAHGHLIVHRDIKPSNVLVRGDGQVKLVDFGIAKLLERDDEGTGAQATLVTRQGERAMTPQFAAPEQISGQPVTTSTDVYSLGVLLYTLLTGRYPFDDPTLSPHDLMKAVVETDPLRPSDAATSGTDPDQNAARRGSTTGKLRRDLRGDVDTIVQRAMKKKPGERYRSVDALADDLRRYLNHHPILARADSLSYRAVKLVQRHRALSAVSALAIVSTLTAFALAIWQANEARQERDRALNLLARSNALTEFFEFLLNDAGPPDQPLTIRAMLSRSESLLSNEFASNPEHQAAILGVQGSYYATFGEAADAEARLKRAQTLAAGSADVDLRATIDCRRGYALAMLGKVDEGIREIDRVLSGPVPSPARTAFCNVNGTYIAQIRGDGANADRFAQAAQQALDRSDRPYPSLEAIVMANRGYAKQLLGRIDEANRFFSQAVEKLTVLGRERTPDALSVRNNWGIAILSSGDIKRALAVYEDAMRAVEARDQGGQAPGYLTGNLAKSLELAGRYPEALKLYEDAAQVARSAGNQNMLAFPLLQQAGVYAELGNADRAEAQIEEARIALGGSIPSGPAALTVLQLTGRIALLRGQLAAAKRTFGEVVAAHMRQGRANTAVVMARLYLADIALRSGQPDEAVSLAQQALEEAQALQGGIRHSNRTGMSYLSLAEARLAQGQTDSARQSLTSALEHLEEALGPNHPATRRARVLETRMAAAAR